MEEKKVVYKWMVASNIRELVNEMNDKGIEKKNIISLLFNQQYILVYSD